ncbi:MAG: universal stress protein [Deltaproteobacteria bacterium]
MSEPIPGRKVLVTADGSVYSNNAINYLIDLYAGVSNISFHLFSVFNPGPLPPAGREWMDELSLMNALSREARNRYSRIRRYLDTAAERMVRGGFAAERIPPKCSGSAGALPQIYCRR